jgi:hypothetical protein
MEINLKSILVCLLMTSVVLSAKSQEHFLAIGVSTHPKSIKNIMSTGLVPQVDFAIGGYVNNFHLDAQVNSGKAYFVNLSNRVKYNKNAVSVNLQAGFSSYNYSFGLSVTDSLSSEIKDPINAPLLSDRDIWSMFYGNGVNLHSFDQTIIYPSIRLNFDYFRTLLVYKGLNIESFAGITVDQRFNFVVNNLQNVNNEGGVEEMIVHFDNHFAAKTPKFGLQIGFNFKLNSNNLKFGYGFNFGNSGLDNEAVYFNEGSVFLAYSKTLQNTKITKEQLLISKQDKQTNSKFRRLRKGDKYSFINFHIGNNVTAYFDSDPDQTELWDQNGSSGTRVTSGYTLNPNIDFSMSFNSFVGNRVLAGLGVDFRGHKIFGEGVFMESTTGNQTTFGYQENLADGNNGSTQDSYGDVLNVRYYSPSLLLAFYFNGSQRAIEPFVRARTIYNLTNFTAPSQYNYIDRDHISSFTTFRLGGGIDFRMRVISSKYIVLSVSGDYVIDPIKNYAQVSISLGYYRKKKLENQRN